ncbi:hypothetical protein [Pedobacter mendelii]|uniref:Uncharacterized protein n=1 Tax=Pedobacter mendelii TaxID=1908240 RepID=A0ABQ2BPA4_9SPHI|nr:hypothetical protein [Pedobacter mendelii]GGI29067.1 hypothetical protein GCM10008119_35780 [Pedobacter mendelii]
MTEEEFRKPLAEKVDSVKMDFVKAHISRFIRNPQVLEIWSPVYFHDLTAKMKIEHGKV